MAKKNPKGKHGVNSREKSAYNNKRLERLTSWRTELAVVYTNADRLVVNSRKIEFRDGIGDISSVKQCTASLSWGH